MKNKRIRSKSILALLTLALAVGFVGLNNKTNFKVDAAPIEVTTSYQEEVNYAPVYPTNLPEGINLSKLRIWVERRDHYMDGFTYLLRIGSDYYRPSGYHEALQPTNAWFPFYDISISLVNGADVGLSVLNDSNNEIALDIPAQTFTAGDNSKLWYVTFTAGTWAYSKTTVTGKVFNTFFAKVLEGYITCLSSIHNGYGAYNLVNTNFVELDINNNWNMEGLLSDVNINDYMYQMDYSSGFRPLEVNAYDKYLALQAYYDAANPAPITLNFDSNAQITTLIIIALAGILTLAGYILLRKRYRLIK